MDFDEMKKVWDSSSQQFYFGVNQKTLHEIVVSKQGRAYRTINFTELLLAGGNVIAGLIVIIISLLKASATPYVYGLGAWMIGCGTYVLVRRASRIRGTRRFDRTVAGDLDHAIHIASEQVRLSRLGRWNAVPVAVITTVALWRAEHSAGFVLAFLFLIVLASWAAGWEHRFYQNRKRELESLRHKLVAEG